MSIVPEERIAQTTDVSVWESERKRIYVCITDSFVAHLGPTQHFKINYAMLCLVMSTKILCMPRFPGRHTGGVAISFPSRGLTLQADSTT